MGPLHGTPCPPCIGLPPWDPLLTVALLVFHSCPEVEVSLLGSSEVWKVFARHEHPHSMRNLHRAGMCSTTSCTCLCAGARAVGKAAMDHSDSTIRNASAGVPALGPLGVRVRGSGSAFKFQCSGSAGLLAALGITVQALGPALSCSGQCAFASHVPWKSTVQRVSTHH